MAKVEVQADAEKEAASSETAEDETTQNETSTGVEGLATTKQSKFIDGRSFIEAVLVILLVAVAAYAWNLRVDRNNLSDQLAAINANPQIAVQKQTQDLISSVSKLYNLPQGETPTVAAVTNAAQAKKQSAFFDQAQNGDKVLLYVKAGEAILYRPSTDKIILVAPLSFSNTNSSSNQSGTTPESTGTTSDSSKTSH